MGKGWKAARAMLASNFCVNPSLRDSSSDLQQIRSLRDLMEMDKQQQQPPPSPSTKRSKSTGSSKAFAFDKGSCSICLDVMKPGGGHALFTAECSHMFHFSCIASNVRHGNRVCPVCRAQWVDLPWSTPDPSSGSPITAPVLGRPQHYDMDPVLRILNESIQRERARFNNNISNQATGPATRIIAASRVTPDSAVFDDDEEPSAADSGSGDLQVSNSNSHQPRISAHSETSTVAAQESRSPFTILLNLRAPGARGSGDRAPIDLVTVLDTSGSMAGAKLALVKSAVEFVIGQLSPRDRLSVIAFSTSAVRLFPLRCMTEPNKRRAVRSVQSLAASGGTNIGDGLKKAVKVLTDRRYRRPVASVMLLSDGQDTSASATWHLSSAVRRSGTPPVHTFGFGSDHDSATLHGIAEVTRGTFSFVAAAGSVRDAFAQCVGGLLSVTVQSVQLKLRVTAGNVKVLKIEDGGSIESRISTDGSFATLTLGDLYAEEERDVLVQVELGKSQMPMEQGVFNVGCVFRDPVRPEEELRGESCPVLLMRSASEPSKPPVNVLVDRQRNRLLASESMVRSRLLADAGDLRAAQEMIVESRQRIAQSPAFLEGDLLSKMLFAELGEVLHRMGNRRIFEESGRAFALSAHSSHSHQRATMRHGADDDLYGHSYQTASMAEMVHVSQNFGKPSSRPSVSRIGRSKSSRKVTPSN